MKHNNIARYVLIGLLSCNCAATAVAAPAPVDEYEADATRNVDIAGIVLDEDGQPIPGVKINVVNTTIEDITGLDGEFSIAVPQGADMITLQHIGYRTTTEVLRFGETNVIKMDPDNHGQSNVLTLAQQLTTTEEALTGSVSVVKGEDLLGTPSSGTTPRLAGRLSGLSFITGSSEPNGDGGTFFVRGRRSINGNDPLIVLNGVPSPTTDVNALDPNSIEDIVMLKDASAMALYGQQGANGAILINTKQGNIGRTRINVSAEFAIQNATVVPTVMNSWQYATLRDHALLNDGYDLLYSQEAIDKYREGTNPLYPNNRWYDMYVKDMATMQRYNVNVSGGNQRVLYFINASYMHQGSIFKTEKQERYDPKFYLNRFNVTSNLQVNILNNLKASLNSNVIIDNQNQPNSNDFMGTILRTSALEFGPTTSEVLDENGEVLIKNGGVIAQDYNMNPIYGRLNKSGYQNTTRTTINVALNLDWGLDFITKGLSARALLGYESRYAETTTGSIDYQRYILDDEATASQGVPAFMTYGNNVDTPLSLGKGSSMYYYLNFMGMIQYNRVFNRDHSVDAALSYFYQDYEKENFDAAGMLPYNRSNVALHAKYGFKNRYFVQFDGAYSGSEAFCKAPGKTRYGFFPAVSGSWVLSNEDFFGRTDAAKWLTLAKIRASYGMVGNDIVASGRRYLYMDSYTVGGGGYLSQAPYYGAMAGEGLLGNPAITWEKIHKQNYGIDLGFFNQLTLHLDYFYEKSTDLVVQSALFPDFSGTDRGNLPYTNFGKMKNQGFDFDVNYIKRINSDLTLALGAHGGYAKNTVIDSGELDRTANGYYYGLRSNGFSVGQNWGYLIDYSNGNGFYNSQAEIAAGPKFEGQQPRVGDFRYVDLNGDGYINDKDQAPIGGTDIPTFNYGIDARVNWKNFDFYVFFQGATGRSVYTTGLGATETESRGTYTDIHLQAYTADRYAAGQEISYPALTTNASSTSLRANSFFITNRDYCRLKTVEIGYTLPTRIVKKAYMSNVRFFVSGMNLLTFDSRKFKDIDVEAINCASYPVYRTYNIGVKVSF